MKKLLILTLSFILISSGLTFAKQMPKGEMCAATENKSVKALNKEKAAEFKKIMLEQKLKINENKAKIENACLKLNAELEKDSPDKTIITGLTADIEKARTEILNSKIDTRLKLKTVLTPEQFQKLPSINDNYSMKMKMKMNKKSKPQMKMPAAQDKPMQH
jgi:Spy/CpxP family protein refolding chaperone